MVEKDIHKYDKGYNIFNNNCRNVYITEDYQYIFDLKPNQNFGDDISSFTLPSKMNDDIDDEDPF